MFAEKLNKGDGVRVVAPSRTLAIISKESREIANQRFADLGLELSFSKHAEEADSFRSSSIESRVEDLHEAFADKSIKAIITVIGGFNCNQLLRYLDWELIKNNPKIFCGYSDITALNNAIFTKTGLVNYSGPHYSSFGEKLYFDYTLDYFKKCLMAEDSFDILPAKQWSDDAWYMNQEDRTLIDGEGFWLINKGEAFGTILGANLCTLNLLQGTEYFPNLQESILFLEDDDESLPHTFDRDLQSLIHQPGFEGVRGIVMGRFQRVSKMTEDLLRQIIKTKKELGNMPIVANVDFGHTCPRITFPIGGELKLSAGESAISLKVVKH
ncbi:MAG: S66 peptidase family protein [bacterium]